MVIILQNKMEANKDVPLFTNIFTFQESSLPSLPSHGLFHCKLVLITNNSVYSYYLLKKYTKCLHQDKPQDQHCLEQLKREVAFTQTFYTQELLLLKHTHQQDLGKE